MESTIKRINCRIKGTEKFRRDGPEPMLQLAADKISETEPLETYWRTKQQPRTANANPEPKPKVKDGLETASRKLSDTKLRELKEQAVGWGKLLAQEDHAKLRDNPYPSRHRNESMPLRRRTSTECLIP